MTLNPNKKQKETINMSTGEVTVEKLNEVIEIRTIRPDGSLRIQQDFSNCPTMAEQHTAHLTNINYLMEKYRPDELAAYIAARNQYRQEIKGHDFSSEPSMQDAKNIIYESKQAFLDLPSDVRNHFQSHLEFLKFIDNPKNTEKMIRLGILTPRQIDAIAIPDTTSKPDSTPAPTPKKESP